MNVFKFYSKADLTILSGKKAKNITELFEGVQTVPDSSIYYHTHKYLQQHHYHSPEPPNDFAFWITNVVNEDALGERVSSIDIIQYDEIAEIRQAILKVLEDYLKQGNIFREAPSGEEFHFICSKVFIYPTHYYASTLKEFRNAIENISINSLYYHLFDSRLRLKNGENDFSLWFRSLGNGKLAAELLKLDPYTMTLEGLRNKVINMIDIYADN